MDNAEKRFFEWLEQFNNYCVLNSGVLCLRCAIFIEWQNERPFPSLPTLFTIMNKVEEHEQRHHR